MPLVLVSSPRFVDHVTPAGHPERPERAETLAAVAARFRDSGGTVLDPRLATDDDLARVHTREYIASIVALRGRATMIDEDTFTSPDSDDIARLAAGAALTAVDHVLDGPAGSRALALVRPPGHHAEAGKAMGFCLYNNIAVGAAYARSRGLSRVAIVDYDVHHGNGTQAMFYADPSVLFVSSHQYPFWPGSGAAGETGRGAGEGVTLNIPLTMGDRDDVVERKYAELVLPRLREFKPELLMISAGFDAHELDPLGQLRMTTAGFARLTQALRDVANDVCEGRVVLATEGGYDLKALSESLDAVIEVCR
ncbi:MAG: histone deacetylase [Acidobacteriota bacterium]|nr:histone deacetylase [Acidobacteriota bacterium]